MTSSAASDHAFLNDVTFEPRDGTTIPHLLFFAFQAHLLHHHRGAGVRRGRGADAVRRVPGVRGAVVGARLRRARALGLRRRLADRGRDARLRRRRAGGDGSGFSALAAALVVGARKDYGRQALLPHNAVYVLLGAGLLWFGWFGFNGGSGFSTGNTGVLAFVNTLLTPGVHAGHVVRPRPHARPPGHRDRRGDGDHRGLRAASPRPAGSSAPGGRWCSARWRRCRATP